jgi:asparagine synthase (glutamine-hydrolysing)
VVLPVEVPLEVCHHLRGEFAFAVVDKAADRVYFVRDPLGVKPLYWSRREGHLYAASELKALVPAGGRIHEIPSGHHGWGSPAQDPAVTAYVDLLTMGDDDEPVTDVEEAARQVRATLEDSIRVRLDTDLTVGVVLSGGLDSTLALLHVREMHPDCVAFTIGTPGGEDVAYARRVTRDLGVHHEVIELTPGDIRLPDIREAIRMSELTEYGDVINAVISRPLLARVRNCGVKVVLCGDGSDELFGGYEMYQHPTRCCGSAYSSTNCATSGGPSCSALTAPAWGRAWRRVCHSWTWPLSGSPCACPLT